MLKPYLARKWLVLFNIFILPCLLQAQEAMQIDNAVILAYHHVSENTPASTSVSPEQFREHMDWLAKHHTVLPLTEIINKLRRGQPLPDKAVAITFDDGYQNVFNNAHPILQEYKFSYTVFVSPDLIGKQTNQLTWTQVKELHRQGVIFANHSSAHGHLLQRLPKESKLQWLDRTLLDIRQAEAKLKDQLGYSLKYIAYPYGEYNLALKQALSKLGYIGFAQHSGAIASHSDFAALPRFPAAGIYANLNTLKTKLNSLAMFVRNQDYDPEIDLYSAPQHFQLVLSSEDFRPSQLNCFFRNRPAEIDWDIDKLNIRIASPLNAGRSRINCTAPSKRLPGRFYWYSLPIFIATAEGKWLD